MTNGFDMSVFKQPKSDLIKKMLIALFADILIGFGIAFNACAGFGNDPISVLFDGIHTRFGLTLGMASDIANYTMFIIVLIFGRRYINIGTFIYTLPLGFFVNVGISLYKLMGISDVIIFRILMSVLACVILFLGIAFYIDISIGVDPWTGFAMILKDKTGKQYKVFRVAIDMSALVIGFLLGGKVGATTVVAALVGGPVIQAFSQFIEKSILGLFKFKNK